MDGMNFSRHSLKLVSRVLALLTLLAAPAVWAQPGKYIFYVGTYTGNGNTSKGIYAYRFDASTGESTPVGLVADTANPSFLALSPHSRYLYAVNELDNYQGARSGAVSAFAVDRPTGRLTFLNEVGS